ncbi:MAG: hypothetical protein J5I93_14815, partial [Pirellulaceae bacterium]|nr:hypothetical protein [Pirellulaceae bacterium]
PPVPAGEPAAAPGEAAGAGDPSAPSVAFPPPQRPAPREIDVAAQLATPILEIVFEDTPLDGFLQFVWQFSTVPVSVDLDALQRRKLNLHTPIRLTRSDTSLGEVLAAGLQPLGLGYVVAAGQLRIVDADQQPREVRYPVDDLIGDDQAAAATLVRWVATFAQPAAWAAVGEGNRPRVEGQSLVVQHTPAVQFAVVELLERLRAARQLPLRSDYDAAMFQLPTRRERASQKLAETFLLNFTQPTPLPRILQRIGEDTGAHLVVDWQALGQSGWTPETRLQFSSDSRPLRVALNSLLRPLDLVYRVIDAETIEVTTSQALEQDPDLECYKVDGLLKNDDPDARQLMDRTQQTLGKDLFAPAGAGAMQFDPASQCLLVLLPQSRQLELYELLLQLRARP